MRTYQNQYVLRHSYAELCQSACASTASLPRTVLLHRSLLPWGSLCTCGAPHWAVLMPSSAYPHTLCPSTYCAAPLPPSLNDYAIYNAAAHRLLLPWDPPCACGSQWAASRSCARCPTRVTMSAPTFDTLFDTHAAMHRSLLPWGPLCTCGTRQWAVLRSCARCPTRGTMSAAWRGVQMALTWR